MVSISPAANGLSCRMLFAEVRLPRAGGRPSADAGLIPRPDRGHPSASEVRVAAANTGSLRESPAEAETVSDLLGSGVVVNLPSDRQR